VGGEIGWGSGLALGCQFALAVVGGGDDAGMEARIAKFEAGQDYIQRDVNALKDDVRAIREDINGIRTTDFRLLFGAIIAVAIGLASLMARGFHWI
jgi:hypothetical protein